MSIRLGMLRREQEAISLVRYRENLVPELQALGVTVLPFGENEAIPAVCDVVWDPGMGRNRLPSPIFKTAKVPVVVTLHGSATFTLGWRDVYSNLIEAMRDKIDNYKAMRAWSWFRTKLARVIAVSNFGAEEAMEVYGLSEPQVKAIYHGVDHVVFSPHGIGEPTKNYLLHVSAYQPKKNIARLITAYSRLPQNSRPQLVLVAPGYTLNEKFSSIPGIIFYGKALNQTELAQLYRKAIAFVFPSLHETFGLPIVEAMACGCPVITSFDTACAEVASDSALLVNPRSIEEINEAMLRIILQPESRELLIRKGLVRAAEFTWKKSALEHLKVFEDTISA